jgi:uncharacterized hydrophobic protein (TIGR00271 family)
MIGIDVLLPYHCRRSAPDVRRQGFYSSVRETGRLGRGAFAKLARMERASRSEVLRQTARDESRLSQNYLLLIVASCIIATLGLLENSVAVIIGAMIIAPLMSPIQAFAFAALDGDAPMIRRSLLTALTGAVLAIGTSALLGVVAAAPVYGSEVVARTRPNLFDLGIAVTAGAVAGIARVRPAISSTIAGTAIAVALMPPLCVVGLNLAHLAWSAVEGALLLFGTNFLGIAAACMVVYIVAKEFRSHNRTALVTTIVITALLLFPLGASSLEIAREERIEAQIRHELTTNTVTFKRVNLIDASFDWYRKPVTVRLTVNADEPVTPSQVDSLERFVQQRTGQRVMMTMFVNQFATVTDGHDPNSDPADEK